MSSGPLPIVSIRDGIVAALAKLDGPGGLVGLGGPSGAPRRPTNLS